MLYTVYSDELYHYGMPRRSGRYKWGSGDRPYQSLGYKSLSKDQRKALSKDEKYRRQSVDEADRKYGTVSDYYQKRMNRYLDKANKLDNKYYDTLEKGYKKVDPRYVDKNGEHDHYRDRYQIYKTDTQANKLAAKVEKYRNKANIAQVGKDICDALLETDISKIQAMDVSADKKARGKAAAKQLMAEMGIVLAANAVSIPTTGMAVIPIYGRTNYNRLNKEDISTAYSKVKSANNDQLTSKESKEALRAISRTTGISSSWLKKQNNSKTVDPDSKEVDVKRGSVNKPDSKYKNTENEKREWYTKDQQATKLKIAKEKDSYDLYFLEAIQNSKILYDDNKTAIDREYKKYLEDPDEYFLTGSKKLQNA